MGTSEPIPMAEVNTVEADADAEVKTVATTDVGPVPNAFITKGALLTQHQNLDPDAETTLTDFTWGSGKLQYFHLPDGTQFFLGGILHVIGSSLPEFHVKAVQVTGKAGGDLGITTKVFLRNGSEFRIRADTTIYNVVTGLSSVLKNCTLVTLNLDDIKCRDVSYQSQLLWLLTASILFCSTLLIFLVSTQTLHLVDFVLILVTLITCASQLSLYVIQQNFALGTIPKLHTIIDANTSLALLMLLEAFIWIVMSFPDVYDLSLRMIYFGFSWLLARIAFVELCNS